MGITYYLHCVWRPQSSGKVERANQFLKLVIKKDNPGDLPVMEGGFTKIALLHTRIAPKEQVCLSPYEILYGRPFVYVNNLSVLYHGHWAIPIGYMLVGCQPGPKRF